MALASIIINVYKEVGPPPIGNTKYSWLSKGVAVGVNKHIGWIMTLILWRSFKW